MTVTRKAYRPAGTGGVRNRGSDRNPRWEAIYFVQVNGKRKQLSKGGFRRKKDAEEWLSEELEKVRDGTSVLPSRLTTGEFLDRWLTVKSHGLKPSTALNYRSIIEGRLKPAIGDVRLQDLRPDHIAKMLESLRQPGTNRRGKSESGLSETSLVRTVQVLRTALDSALKAHQLSTNPADGIVKPKPSKRKAMSVWTASDLAHFHAVTSLDRLHPLLQLASHTGMRRGELLGLRWEHVFLNEGYVTVVASRTKVGSRMVEGTTKTSTGVRRIDIDDRTIAVLRRWKVVQTEEQLRWGPASLHTGYVFTREDGTPVHADHLAGRFPKLVAAAKVPAIRFHDLRHTHATLMLLAGVPVKVVAERLGHASPGFTLSTYAHVLPGQQAAAASAFADIVASAQQ